MVFVRVLSRAKGWHPVLDLLLLRGFPPLCVWMPWQLEALLQGPKASTHPRPCPLGCLLGGMAYPAVGRLNICNGVSVEVIFC